MPPATKHDSYIEYHERKQAAYTDFSRAHTPKWCVHRSAPPYPPHIDHTSCLFTSVRYWGAMR
jgi:hypothetical protein